MHKIYTSIAPFDLKRQREALETWTFHGYPVISINDKRELAGISALNDIVEIRQVSQRNIFDSTHVMIDKIFEEIRIEKEHIVVITNSDIKLIDPDVFNRLVEAVDDQLIYCKKWNYSQSGTLSIEKHGIDMFMFNSKILEDIDSSTLCIGKPLWDFWLPWQFHKKKKKIISVETKFITHDYHSRNWNRHDYAKLEANYRRYPELTLLPRKILSSTIKQSFAQSIVASYT